MKGEWQQQQSERTNVNVKYGPPRYRQAKPGMALRMPGVEVPFP